jgi:hypothetical protein
MSKEAKMKSQFFPLEKEKVNEIQNICSPNRYCVLDQDSIPSVIPEKLKQKCRGAVVVASTCDTGVVYCINLQRVDLKDKAIDQMPYAVVTVPDNAASSCLLHHSDYQGRTTHPDNSFLQMVNASGIEQYKQLQEPLPHKEGPLSELKGSSHEKGFLKSKAVITDQNLLDIPVQQWLGKRFVFLEKPRSSQKYGYDLYLSKNFGSRCNPS